MNRSVIAIIVLILLALLALPLFLFVWPKHSSCNIKLKAEEIQSIDFSKRSRDTSFKLNREEIIEFVQHVNNSKNRDLIKMGGNFYFDINFIDGEQTKIKFAQNTFQLVPSSNACLLQLDYEYADDIWNKKLDIFLKPYEANAVETIERIFDAYNEYQESTDSPENLDSLKRCLQVLERREVSEDDLDLIINVWMYYTVTDFSTQTYVKRVLWRDREKSTSAIQTRMRNKLEWETEEGAPYSELKDLLEELSDPQVRY